MATEAAMEKETHRHVAADHMKSAGRFKLAAERDVIHVLGKKREKAPLKESGSVKVKLGDRRKETKDLPFLWGSFSSSSLHTSAGTLGRFHHEPGNSVNTVSRLHPGYYSSKLSGGRIYVITPNNDQHIRLQVPTLKRTLKAE